MKITLPLVLWASFGQGLFLAGPPVPPPPPSGASGDEQASPPDDGSTELDTETTTSDPPVPGDAGMGEGSVPPGSDTPPSEGPDPEDEDEHDEGDDDNNDEEGDDEGERDDSGPAKKKRPGIPYVEQADAQSLPTVDPNGPPWTRYFRVTGYVQPQFTYRYRPAARERDRNEAGFGSTRGGLVFSGEPIPRFGYKMHLVVGSTVNAVTDVDLVDTDADGANDGVDTISRAIPGVFFEQISLGFRAVDYSAPDKKDTVVLDLTAGILRIPFTAQNRSPNSALMFPRRSTPNNVFLIGTDLGGLLSLGLFDKRIELQGGVFNGTGRAAGVGNERGVLYSGRIDINPLGGFPFKENDIEHGPFRVGLGGGILYFPSRVFDSAGNDTSARLRDLRMSASLRMAFRGIYAQGEFFRRQETDSLSSRPTIATGAYGQASYFIRLPSVFGLAPQGRFGWTEFDQSFDPRTAYFAEGGLSFFVGSKFTGRPDAFRFLVSYVGEWRVTEGEVAHGAVAQAQLRF